MVINSDLDGDLDGKTQKSWWSHGFIWLKSWLKSWLEKVIVKSWCYDLSDWGRLHNDMIQHSHGKWPIEIDGEPNFKMVDLSMAMLNNQMVIYIYITYYFYYINYIICIYIYICIKYTWTSKEGESSGSKLLKLCQAISEINPVRARRPSCFESFWPAYGPMGLNLSQNHTIQKFINQGCSKHPRYVWGVNWVNVEVKCTFPPSRGFHMPSLFGKKRPIHLDQQNLWKEDPQDLQQPAMN
jgi:hypothetical protein